MKVLNATISDTLAFFLLDLLANQSALQDVNSRLQALTGICDFFDSDADWQQAKRELANITSEVAEHNAIEYGDFQTNESLAGRVCDLLTAEGYCPTVVVEPTCGQGNFIIAALKQFDSLQTIYGVEIYKPYLYQCKFNILSYYREHPRHQKPLIHLLHQSVFDIDFSQSIQLNESDELLIIGNPPWVTNATLGTLTSNNLPTKTNFKQHSGLDALTGKSNFDIAEFITIQLLKQFHYQRGHLALLVKNSVIKNIVYDQASTPFAISKLRKRVIDAKKEFNVSVDAALFTATLNSESALTCIDSAFANDSIKPIIFGWVNLKFVSNKALYDRLAQFDGKCSHEWRQGLKHDCSAVMELDRVGDHYVSAIQPVVHLEDDLVFPLYKSSDLQKFVVEPPRKYTLVTQQRIGQDTGYIRLKYPLTYQYLRHYQARFDSRKSSIYKGKPPYSIFGIGDYSFKPFKVAISSLYKEPRFALVVPINGKPAMLDDTCYFLGFDDLTEAIFTCLVLNHPTTRQLLQVITFNDAKRVYTKDILMRINLKQIATSLFWNDIKDSCPNSLQQYINKTSWERFSINDTVASKEIFGQLTLF